MRWVCTTFPSTFIGSLKIFMTRHQLIVCVIPSRIQHVNHLFVQKSSPARHLPIQRRTVIPAVDDWVYLIVTGSVSHPRRTTESLLLNPLCSSAFVVNESCIDIIGFNVNDDRWVSSYDFTEMRLKRTQITTNPIWCCIPVPTVWYSV